VVELDWYGLIGLVGRNKELLEYLDLDFLWIRSCGVEFFMDKELWSWIFMGKDWWSWNFMEKDWWSWIRMV
jgi:hypothetical protein